VAEDNITGIVERELTGIKFVDSEIMVVMFWFLSEELVVHL
jgi:hypothetical protein